LGRGTDRRAAALAVVQARLQTQWLNTPVLGGVLIGGQSSRMGTPKHLISTGAGSWLERTVELLDPLCRQVVVLGGGSIPATLADRLHLSDVLDVQGPLAGVLAAMRWAPWASWLFLACDLPAASADALGWLLGTRRPGVWATIPAAREGLPEPLLAHYDFRSLQVLEHMAAGGDFGLRKLATHPKVVSPTVPLQLANAWRNVNTRRDLQDFVDCKHG
jgi:molybdopterin-guanine dinucleotide biosynthesis protein A